MRYLILLCILLPILGSILIKWSPITLKKKDWFNFALIIITSLLTLSLVIFYDSLTCPIFNYNEKLSMFLKIDGIGKIFATLIAILWPFAYLYQIGYMQNDDLNKNYSMFYTMTFGSVLGIAFSANLITLYFFYELLTLFTLPLIMHQNNKESKRAGRFYLYISLFGSSLALIGIIILIHAFNAGNFNDGFNILNNDVYIQNKRLAYFAYLLMFFGFGVKAAIFPLHTWLAKAGVAPTPTTALLHAVAVVKSGAFAIIRMIYYVFTPQFLNHSWVQAFSVIIVSFTIIYGSSKALKQAHLKRRLAYSTMANISYILLAALMMNKVGLFAAVCHFIFHSIAKIALFFICGVLNKKGIIYTDDVDGVGKTMPMLFVCFCFAGLSLIGIPLFAGFISKVEILKSLIMNLQYFSYIGIIAILFSAILTMIYIGDIIFRAFFKPLKKLSDVHVDKKMMIPIACFSILSLLLGIFSMPVLNLIEKLL